MKRLIFVAVAIAIGGCAASMPEMRAIGPQASFITAKSEQETAQCILYAWQNESLAGVRYDVTLQPRPGGGQSVVNQGQREMADVVRSNGGTQVRFYTNTGHMTWISDRRVESIKTCL